MSRISPPKYKFRDILLGEYVILLMLESGAGLGKLDEYARPASVQGADLIRILLTANLVKEKNLERKSVTVLEYFRHLRSLSEHTGAVYAEHGKRILRDEIPGGFVKRPANRRMLSLAAVHISQGMSLACVVYGDWRRLPTGDVVDELFKNTKEPDLRFAFELLKCVAATGGNIADYLEFLVGRGKLLS